ncbi:class I SAM-dependent methyltransferase [Jiangella alkaliphila]|uniref:Methyltransferase domain-containing protein n=1 Tax=Jiangella alkaliphila TaxID=419479 RepID=A0A1H2KRD8_9ACTN|nr:class I SAM-dependent methyltransferase [Jiangella alkaliphila]SDU71095.1 Methyltransferase domain-containing protein [Jiangella alkaliphila]
MDTAQDFVSTDGSPLALYLAIPAGTAPTIVHDAVPAGSSILELGSGPGRLTRVLVAYGHPVTAVDDSQEMLDHVTGARRVRADLHEIDLGETFDVVLGASHLINQPDPAARAALLRVCRQHVAGDGVVLLERYPRDWAANARDAENEAGPVRLTLEAGEYAGGVRSAAMTYRLGTRSWRQEFTATDVGDDQLTAEAAAAGLAFDGVLDDAGTWVRLRPQD